MSHAYGTLPNLTTAYQACRLTGQSSKTEYSLVIDTASNSEQYGVDLLTPETTDVTITSDGSATKAEIADDIAAAWNADATAAYWATAESDGVDTVTFTGTSNTPFTMAKDENAAKMTLTQEPNVEVGGAYSVNIPYGAKFNVLSMWLGSVNAATTVTWYLSADEAGLYALTDPYESTISEIDTAIASVDPLEMDNISVSTPGSIFLQIKTDVADGMDLSVARVFW
jgi:hypothetical protein